MGHLRNGGISVRYYKKAGGEYTATVGVITDAEEITKEEYDTHIEEVIRRLPDPDPTDEEILNILLGGESE